jgi:putative aldouronate transport system permease protein
MRNLHIMILASLSDSGKFLKYSGFLWKPLGFSLDAYRAVLANPLIASGYRNTLTILVVGVAINLLLTSLGAYFFSRKNVLFRDVLMFLIVVTMFFGGGLIPLYMTVRNYHLHNTLWALILPGAISAYNMIIMRSFMNTIPHSLEESASMDGANHLIILFRIYLPVSMPVIAVMVLYYGVGHWNSWFNSMIFITDQTMYPLQLVLREILIEGTGLDTMTNRSTNNLEAVQESIKYATIVVSILPILLSYPLLQKYFVQGMMLGSIKG